MSTYVKMKKNALTIMKEGGVWIPCPMPLNERKEVLEDQMRLLVLYYIKSGARCVVPCAHTGEFGGYGILPPKQHYALYERWLVMVKEMSRQYGKRMLLMSMVHDMKHVELSAKHGYDAVTVSPKCFKGMEDDVNKQIRMARKIASIMPVYGFYLQKRAGGIEYPREFWEAFFEFGYGAKLAPFDRYRTLTALEAAAASKRRAQLTLVTGNDDHIVGDLMRDYTFNGRTVQFEGGLLGHYATDTRAAVRWTQAALHYRDGKGKWPYDVSIYKVLDAVTLCNMALFDAFPNCFRNGTWGVKYRLVSLGLMDAPWCYQQSGDEAIKAVIDGRYDGENRAVVSDRDYVRDNLAAWKREVGLK
jgi:hypothetical protein